jgi:hypothetical protein
MAEAAGSHASRMFRGKVGIIGNALLQTGKRDAAKRSAQSEPASG